MASAQAEEVRLVHALPGRVRIKVRGLKGDFQRAQEIQSRLLMVRGISLAEASPLTGSVLAQYDPERLGSFEFGVEVANALGLSISDFDPVMLAAWETPLHGNGAYPPQEQAASSESLRTLAPLALFLLGVRSLLVAEKLVFPVWYDYFWFAFGSFAILNPTSTSKG